MSNASGRRAHIRAIRRPPLVLNVFVHQDKSQPAPLAEGSFETNRSEAVSPSN